MTTSFLWKIQPRKITQNYTKINKEVIEREREIKPLFTYEFREEEALASGASN